MPNRDRSSGNRSQGSIERDERGRFTDESSDRSSGSKSQTGLDRDERGRFVDESPDRSNQSPGSSVNRPTTRKK